VGALQISSARKESGPVTSDDLREFAAEHIEAGARLRDVTLGDFTGYHLHFGTEGTYWRYWYLRCGPTLVFITYNCALEKRGSEDKEIQVILETLTHTGSPV
jgi:hypothetical protein